MGNLLPEHAARQKLFMAAEAGARPDCKTVTENGPRVASKFDIKAAQTYQSGLGRQASGTRQVAQGAVKVL